MEGGLSTGNTSAQSTIWGIWQHFCDSLRQDPYLQSLSDPVPLLQLFARKYRTGELAPKRHQVSAKTVGKAIRAVGQTLAALGLPDARLTPKGTLDIRLTRQLAAYAKVDPPPQRVKPIPITILRQAVEYRLLATSCKANAIADMLLLGFYFMLRPGEYAHTDSKEASPFRLRHVHLFAGNHRLNHLTGPLYQLASATRIALEFDKQKNGVRGELIGLSRSGHPTICPVMAALNRIRQLRRHNASPDTPLYSFWTGSSWGNVISNDLTRALRAAMATTAPHTTDDISARSLRSSGAMALFCAGMDKTTIQLLGRWKSEELLRYLHTQAFPVTAQCAALMLHHGDFAFIPNQPLPPSRGTV
jgi:hypothetical protein